MRCSSRLNLTNVIAFIAALLTLLAIIAEVATPEIRCWLNLDACPNNNSEIIKPTTNKIPTQKTTPLIRLQAQTAIYIEDFQVSLAINYQTLYDEVIASLTISPEGKKAFTKAVLSGYNIDYITTEHTYTINVLSIDPVQQTLELIVTKTK